jgi:hypothetical protein
MMMKLPHLDEEGALQPVALVAGVGQHHAVQQQVLSKVGIRSKHHLQTAAAPTAAAEAAASEPGLAGACKNNTI